jgi:eukaryotic-like serine/threonine-protein kinase
MNAPILSINDVKSLVGDDHEITEIKEIGQGGQKTVFSCNINGEKFALKFLDVTGIGGTEGEPDDTEEVKNEVLARATREIDIMNKCDSPHLVKLGPIGLELRDFNDKRILFFSEEFIDGSDLHKIIGSPQTLSEQNVIQLGIDITNAINQLWSIGMIHRDIKPQNIMQRREGDFVLLDTGIAFDTTGQTLTKAFHIVGTPIYMSPEQLSYARRNLDFRSDLFLLGIVMYQAITGIHPFYTPGFNSVQIVSNITINPVKKISEIIESINPKLERIILRLLNKEPHLRYKTTDTLITQLDALRREI